MCEGTVYSAVSAHAQILYISGVFLGGGYARSLLEKVGSINQRHAALRPFFSPRIYKKNPAFKKSSWTLC